MKQSHIYAAKNQETSISLIVATKSQHIHWTPWPLGIIYESRFIAVIVSR